MVEYEPEKPLLTRFEQLLDYNGDILGKALARAGYGTILSAIKGLDTRLREKILISLPDYLEKKVFDGLEERRKLSRECKDSFGDMLTTKFARQHIVNSMNAINRKIKNEKSSVLYHVDVIKD
jgi:hypothetical protein